MKQQIAVIDYGMGNLHSACSALELVAPDDNVVVTSDAHLIRQADRLVFPGVGAIGECMAEIRRLGIDKLVREQVQEKPVLAICVGMQALMNRSEESGGVDCMGLLDGDVRFFGTDYRDSNGQRLKVPHMGWNQVRQEDHTLWQDIEPDSRFYFVHSYYVTMNSKRSVAGATTYGKEITAAACAKNLFAVQFHPEKSHRAGLQLLRNFSTWNGNQN